MRLSLLAIFFLSLACGAVQAQVANKARYTVTGTVLDSISGKPLQQVTVSLKNIRNTKSLKYGVVNAKGNFSIGLADTGKYELSISFTGYADQRRELTISSDAPSTIEAGTIQMNAQQANLKEVVVTARKPLIEQSDDKITYNAESDPSSKTETAIDLLRKTPFISVDGDNNVQLNGQSNYKILLNGRETAMFAQNAKEALKGFPGALIVKIEVITSPSAKYDAEGVGGIINIITKKKVVGYNGSLSSFYSTNHGYSENANLSLKAGSFGITGYYNINGGFNVPGHNTLETTPLTPSVFTGRKVEGDRLANYLYQFGNVEVSYDIDSLNTMTVYGNTSGGKSSTDLNQVINTTYPTLPADKGTYTQDAHFEYPSTSVGLDYVRKFKSNPEKEFSIRTNGNFSTNNSYNNSIQDNPSSDRFVITNSQSNNKEYTVQADYILPLKAKKKLETGAKMIFRNAQSDFENLLKYNAGDSYKLQPSNTDQFSYRQEVYSAYASFNFALKTYSFRLGARVEQTSVLGDFVSSHTVVQQNYGNLVPNVQVSHKFGKFVTTVLSYNMRLQRPAITSLNPFVSNNDSLNQSYGNPNLGPQIIHAVSLQNRILAGKTFLGITFTASHTNNSIVQYAVFNPATGVTSVTSANIGTETQLAVSLNLSTSLNKDWNLYVNGNMRYNHITNNTDVTQTNGGISGFSSISTSYKVTKRFTISGSGYYFQNARSLATYSSASYGHQVNFAYKFFNEKVSVQVNVNNIQQTDFTYRSYTVNSNVRTVSSTVSPYRVIYFGVNWNFGKLKENVSKKKGVTNDDLVGGSSQSN